MSKARQKRQRVPSSRRPAKKPTLVQMHRKVEEQPMEPAGWKALGEYYANKEDWENARSPLERAFELAPQDPGILELLGRTESGQGNDTQALALLEQGIGLAPDNAQILFSMARVYHERAEENKALEYIERALEIAPDKPPILTYKGNVLYRLHRYSDAFEVFCGLTKKYPQESSHWNNAGNVLRDLGDLDEAVTYYQKAVELSTSSAISFSNHLTALHYHPQATPEDIFKLSQEWKARFAPCDIPKRPLPKNISPDKRLRIGMISDGFRSHPVGKMITAALEKLVPHQFELFAYSTNSASDTITQRIRNITTQWKAIRHFSDEALAQQIREDQIDILIDLAGHNTGNRMRVMAMQPAPLLVKWVGGLINTTGLDTIDYLISDAIETPPGSDDSYVEKLIRMPDDYICYEPPAGVPPVSELPANRNGYITLGCFNNAAKVNNIVLAEWAKIMHQLPESRLFLKSFQYNSTDLCDKIRRLMVELGIEAERLIIEGSSPHLELMEAYNRVDIALDPWPYSGGLTTCEAFIMGVPVVTLPGPTFAGRHSATHLVNAGMPELVVNSWEEYRTRVIGLASDLESLGTIRQHLRDVLLQSPVCDGPRFAKHFTDAMRAIWQRYCDSKAPAALTFNKEGEARFEDEDAPVEIHYAEAPEDDSTFQWQFKGKIIAVDNGWQLLESDVVRQLLQNEALELIAFDPSSQALDTSLKQHKGVHYYPNATLGDGQPGQLYACLDPKLSASLAPLGDEHQPVAIRKGSQVLIRLQLNTIALDSIQGLPAIDWLVLDALNDAAAVLDNGAQALKDTLLLQVKVAFQPTHERQPNLAELQHWASRNGFRFYRLHEPQHRSHLPEDIPEAQRQATELVSADALFLPNSEHMTALSDGQRMKLSFILHTAYGIRDLSHNILQYMDDDTADRYLSSLRENTQPSCEIPRRTPGGVATPAYRENTISHEIDRLLSLR